MKYLERAGTHLVTLRECHWSAAKSNNGFIANLVGETDQGETITAYLSATNTLIKSGRDAGKKMMDKTLADLKDLGMPDDPTRIGELVGQQAQFVCEFEGGDNGERPRLRVKFVNKVRRATAAELNAVGAFFKTGVMPAAPAAAPAVPDYSDIPI